MNSLELDAVVQRRDVVADGVVALMLCRPDGGELPVWEAGAHIDVRLDDELLRQYSLCGDPACRDSWRVAVLLEQHGRGGSTFVHEQLSVGTRLRVSRPRNNFKLEKAPRYLFIAGGIGITPILPMVASAHAAGASWRLLYGGRRHASMAFLDELSAYGDHVRLWPQDTCGLLPLDEVLHEPDDETLVYCCGPELLLTAVEERCATWPPGALHVERFTPRPVAEPVRQEAFEVVLQQSGKTVVVTAGISILQAIEDAGVAVLSSCREGTCGTCETDVLEGVPDHRDSVLTASEQAANDVMMICVSRSCGARLVLDL